MAVLFITYKLETAGKDYAPFHDTVKGMANGWWRYFDNSWMINTQLTAEECAKKLYPHMTTEDRLFVVKITREYHGWLPEEAWKWLSDREF